MLERFQQGVDELIAPDMLIAEATNVFWKRFERGDLTAQEAADSLNDLLAINLPFSSAATLASQALTLAIMHHRSAYDCLYLALALEQNCDLATSDERLFNALSANFPQIKLLQHLTL